MRTLQWKWLKLFSIINQFNFFDFMSFYDTGMDKAHVSYLRFDYSKIILCKNYNSGKSMLRG